jgi:hypothetical protein
VGRRRGRKEGRRKRTCSLQNDRRKRLLSVGNRSKSVGGLEEALGESRGEVVPLASAEEESESASYGRMLVSTAYRRRDEIVWTNRGRAWPYCYRASEKRRRERSKECSFRERRGSGTCKAR